MCVCVCVCVAGGSSDLAYETMYDDDDMMNRPQTMPWFDPNYLASNDYEGVSPPKQHLYSPSSFSV